MPAIRILYNQLNIQQFINPGNFGDGPTGGKLLQCGMREEREFQKGPQIQGVTGAGVCIHPVFVRNIPRGHQIPSNVNYPHVGS